MQNKIKFKISTKSLMAIISIIMLCTFFVSILAPDNTRDMTYSEVAKYRIVWSILGVAQVILTLLETVLLISLAAKTSTSKVDFYACVLVWLCIAVMWLSLTLPPIAKFVKKSSTGTILRRVKVSEIGDETKRGQVEDEKSNAK